MSEGRLVGRREGLTSHGTTDVPVFRDGRLQDPAEDRIGGLEDRLADAERVIQEQAQALAVERSKREALEEAAAPLLERLPPEDAEGKGGASATR